MGQVAITINNRTYRLACGDGEEPRLRALAADVKARIDRLSLEFGQAADERILLMAAVMLADELMDVREAHDAMLEAAAAVLREAGEQPGAAAGSGGAAAKDGASPSSADGRSSTAA